MELSKHGKPMSCVMSSGPRTADRTREQRRMEGLLGRPEGPPSRWPCSAHAPREKGGDTEEERYIVMSETEGKHQLT